MELWIRSQDREKLVLTKGFETQHTNYDGGCQIFAVWQNNYQMVGKYKSKERALEVLDEIQSILDAFVNSNYLKNVTDVSKQVYIAPFIVYEMPKE